jgi:hypothetical protein
VPCIHKDTYKTIQSVIDPLWQWLKSFYSLSLHYPYEYQDIPATQKKIRWCTPSHIKMATRSAETCTEFEYTYNRNAHLMGREVTAFHS